MSGLVYSYSRFSDPRQAGGHSLERQAAYAARWAAEHGRRLDESLTLHDEGLSAYHQRHVKSGALGTFLAAVEAGKVPPGSVLVVESLDRLSRAEPILAQAQLAQIINADITVVTAGDGKEYSRERLKSNPMDLVYSLLVMIRAHEESDTKSKRVTASIRRQCEAWVSGAFRGVIRNGKDPAWVELSADGKWVIVPERAEAVRAALEMYRRGYGASRIIGELQERNLSLTGRGPQSLQIYRLIHQRGLIGEKELAIDGQEYRLPDYYPALLSQAEWDDLQGLAGGRGRRRAKGPVPHIITGMRITLCGYCGRAMVGQNVGTRRRQPDGRMHDGHRRLHCTSYTHGGCSVGGSISVAPVERALMTYCSDIVNLQGLYGADRTAGPRAALAARRAELEDVEQRLQRMMAALEEGGDAPATVMKRLRELEIEQERCTLSIAAAERELVASTRSDKPGAEVLWQRLAAGVEAQDYDARLQARQLVADTFERLVVYHRGVEPEVTPPGEIHVMLIAKGGLARMLRLNARSDLLDQDEVSGSPAAAEPRA